ncbi:hypothetical protein ACFPN7_32330 [Amycolatopsis halotolerans]
MPRLSAASRPTPAGTAAARVTAAVARVVVAEQANPAGDTWCPLS